MQEVVLHLDNKESYRSREAFKTLRTNIEFSGSDIKVICITSCTPNEGKSSIAINMARAFAEAGQRTLLVDADMRKSVLVGRYKTGAVKKGLIHYLVGRTQEEEVICKSNIKNLYLAFSGPVPPNPSELIGGDRFESFIRYAKDEYDMVLIDTPPLGSVIDAAVAAKQCDGTILVIENNAISYKFAQKVKEQLDVTGCRVLGAVLNKVDMTTKGYYGHYGRYYEKYYGKYYGRYGEDSVESSVDPKLSRTGMLDLDKKDAGLQKDEEERDGLETDEGYKYFL
ncbi:MAG: CpsD/CapB family tyrosine-protein kinase [Lachnospiraceae bacterium]|nr:CpsD/CapB family tyrosine-protein kinase [Lachnospiraceae bacterium]